MPRPAPSPHVLGDRSADRPARTTRPAYARTGAKLGWAVLAYAGCVVLAITLEPFAFQRPTALHVLLWAPDGPWHGWFDVVTNVAMFLPLGFLAALARSAAEPPAADAPPRGSFRWAVMAGAAVSAAIELVQCFEPGRYPSPTDVAANTLGAWLGAWLCRRAAAHLGADTPLLGRLALELPVVGLVYVTLPLLTLAGLTAGAVPTVRAERALALVALGAFGGSLLGTVRRRHLAPAGAVSVAGMAAAAGLWFATGALPAAVTAPAAYAAGIVVAALSAWLVGRGAEPGVRAIERRFESEALGRAAPWLAAYLALVPLGDSVHGEWGRLTILRDLEAVAGYTVLGYLLAEAWGRREWRYRHSAWRVAAAAAGVAIVAAGIGTWETRAPGIGTAAAGVLARAVAAAYGGWIYHLQRAHVRALVAARRSGRGPIRTRTAAGMRPAAVRAA